MNAREARKISFENINKLTEKQINISFNSYRKYFLELINIACVKGEFSVNTTIDTTYTTLHPEVLRELCNNFNGMGYKISISRDRYTEITNYIFCSYVFSPVYNVTITW